MKTQEEISKLLQTNLIKAQVRMKWYADLKCQDKQYEIGDMVYLKLQPYRQHALANTSFRMKWYADLKRQDKQYEIGDMVYLKLQPYRHHSLANTPFHKLAARYYGPFKILNIVGALDSRIHDVFHVSLLKKHRGDHPVSFQLPLRDDENQFIPQPLAVLVSRMKKKVNKPITEVLVQWIETNPKDTVWCELQSMQLQFPNFDWQ